MFTHRVEYTEARIKQLRVLVLIDELSSSANEQVQLAALGERMEREPDLRVVSLPSQLTLLRDEGLVVLDERLGRVIAATRLLPAGVAEVQAFTAWRGSVPVRRRALRDIYLQWIYDEIEVKDAHPSPTDFLSSGPAFAGISYTEVDIEKAGEWLVADGCIKGEGAWGYAGPLYPTLTKKGAYIVENGRSVNDPPPNAGNTFNTVVNGHANLAQVSTNVHQEMTFEWKPQAAALLDTIEQALPALDEDIREAVELRVAAARQELTGPGEVSKVRAAFSNLGSFLSETGAGALGGVLATQVSLFLASLP
ncbi:hypothetical protein [Agreia sp. VKM Ac-1783]|uniref:hypothetical protein n=1 Tax=Agreia sp. VKM Ac-1783 TaxID=1938889 RepID=UPI000A2AC205|nr:hypothetical protein [Agreia sp. VKM Ac-1783]SMQ71910.1 hypothetical protein SAMN06295943_2794 [Agreia sp. VKM Ac-1783]